VTQLILVRASADPLFAEHSRRTNALCWAANFSSVGQKYLPVNPLRREPMSLARVKLLLVGHWGTTPGQNFVSVHSNRVIKKFGLDMFNATTHRASQ
jgi:xylulose-5-phosphate/fructose-6-phosphate phosphoketolase